MGQPARDEHRGPEDRWPRGGMEISTDAQAVRYELVVRLKSERMRIVLICYEDESVTCRLGRG